MLSRRHFFDRTLGAFAGVTLATQGVRPSAAQAPTGQPARMGHATLARLKWA